MNFESWKAACVRHAEALDLPSDLWAEDDPSDLMDEAQEACRRQS